MRGHGRWDEGDCLGFLCSEDRLRLIEAPWDTLCEEDIPITREERALLVRGMWSIHPARPLTSSVRPCRGDAS